MEARQISIVIYGHGAHLQETRKWVLQSQGYRVTTISRSSELNRIPVVPNVALLVLCHTLTPKEREDAASLASVRWPKIKQLSLTRHRSADSDAFMGDVLSTLDSPTKLAAMVGQLVGYAASSPCSHIY